VFAGILMPPETNERLGWKDTLKMYSGYVTRVIARFDLPDGTTVSRGQEIHYAWYCHVLEHENNEMMRPCKIVGYRRRFSFQALIAFKNLHTETEV
jgi:spore coat protein A